MRPLLLSALLATVLQAGIIDRVAVVVGKTVITESEVMQELRLTAFMNQKPLDPSPEQRRAASERLVDQALLRDEMEIGEYQPPSEAEADALLRRFRQDKFPSPVSFRSALEKYGLTEEQLRRHLLWQLTTLRFTEARFRPAVAITNGEHSADRAADGSSGPSEEAVDREMKSWLKEKRAATRIQFKKEAFE